MCKYEITKQMIHDDEGADELHGYIITVIVLSGEYSVYICIYIKFTNAITILVLSILLGKQKKTTPDLGREMINMPHTSHWCNVR